MALICYPSSNVIVLPACALATMMMKVRPKEKTSIYPYFPLSSLSLFPIWGYFLNLDDAGATARNQDDSAGNEQSIGLDEMDEIEEAAAVDDGVDKEVDPLLISDNENLDPSVSGVSTIPVTAVVSATPGSSGTLPGLCSMSIVFFSKRKFLILANLPCLYFFLSCNLCRFFFFFKVLSLR
jgi:hypothetical protein